MDNLWVCNASPLILLHKIDHAHLLPSLCKTLVIPKGVVDEILPFEEDLDKWERFLASMNILKLENSIGVDPAVSAWNLGKGESEVLAWPLAHPGYEAILDDMEARKCARTLNIPLRGTVGIILLAKKNGLISQAKPLIQSLIQAGLRFNENWVNGALKLVGETLKDLPY